MPMPSGIIFPTSKYGTISDKYGLNIAAYNSPTTGNTSGFPAGAGLQLGEFGLLFDGTTLRLFAAGNTINGNDFATPKVGQGNDYTVNQLPAATNGFIGGCNDRLGSQMVANDFAWMTVYGLCKGNVVGNTPSGSFLVSSGVAGFVQAAAAGVSLQGNIQLLQAVTGNGAYNCVIR